MLPSCTQSNIAKEETGTPYIKQAMTDTLTYKYIDIYIGI